MTDTIGTLRARLENAERQLEYARMIDDWTRCQKETAYWQAIVDGLKKRIEEAAQPKPDIHRYIREQIGLAAFYAEDGAFRSAARVLRALAERLENHADDCDERLRCIGETQEEARHG
jgi:hypothetical protein